MEDNLLEEVYVYSTKYTLLDADQYAALNDKISDAMGFDIGKPTERYAPVEPMQAKINIVYDEEGNESFETVPVMQITGYLQKNYPAIFKGIILIDNYIPFIQNVV